MSSSYWLIVIYVIDLCFYYVYKFMPFCCSPFKALNINVLIFQLGETFLSSALIYKILSYLNVPWNLSARVSCETRVKKGPQCPLLFVHGDWINPMLYQLKQRVRTSMKFVYIHTIKHHVKNTPRYDENASHHDKSIPHYDKSKWHYNKSSLHNEKKSTFLYDKSTHHQSLWQNHIT